MAILTPLAIPVAVAASTSGPAPILAATASAILGGAVFGDHCSPISDTTIMSSMASGCDHVDHVRTQLPYALFGATLAVLCGYIPAMLGGPPWLLLILGLGAIGLVAHFLGGEIEQSGAGSR
jgi:Na+/H+ antiporter NhaC